MTTKPPAGIQRQPQRSLSGTGMIQRPTPHRTLSQQYPSSAHTRKSDNFVDLTLDAAEGGRHGASRIGGSRLKVELSTESKVVPVLVESPKMVDLAPRVEPARGRPKLHFDEYRPQLHGAENTSVLSSIRKVENITGESSMPLPRRPVHSAPPFARGQTATPVNGVKKEVRPKPYVLGVPSAAPRYFPDTYADFFPWTGDHPEDQFNDVVIRQGFFDKSQVIQNEIASARLSIFPTLKNKNSLQSLSSLFTGVLKQRRIHSQITSPSTFKPPPRVTLTDTKRETWLKDLANPSVPLRRLSRTIPHGIRGKQLLEQCLSKKIPTARAVWLAKCVGANEIRAFKRKGVTGTFAMGGESKWIRDWTMCVEQFVESVIASCGENDWRIKTLYAVQLAAHLYSEYLLDREHYMDWLSTSLETCPLVKAPIWLLINQIYWNDLFKYRKYGTRTVAALCAHLKSAREDPDQDLLLPLIERLVSLLNGLIDTRSESFISPKLWIKYRGTLASCVSSESTQESLAYIAVDERNRQLKLPDPKMDVDPRRAVIGLLDKSLSVAFSIDLPQQCRDKMPDIGILAKTVLDWSTSSHRLGLTKVYVGARILRTLSNLGIDVNDAVLDFLGAGLDAQGLCKPSVYHLASELIRSGHLSTSKYIQWLIARGGIRRSTDLAEDGPCISRLLAELPMHDSPESLCMLRRTMLSRASFSVEQEQQEIERQIGIVDSYLIRYGGDKDPVTAKEELRSTIRTSPRRPNLSRTVKSAVGFWVRKKVLSYVVVPANPTNTWKEDKPNEVKITITLDGFNVVRDVLEDIEDLAMLADVLHITIPSDDEHILAAVADTLNFHIEEFGAVGALYGLYDKLLARYRSIANEHDSTVLLAALVNLGVRLPGMKSVVQQLSQELLRVNRKTAADACSPVSEYMVEVLQSSESEFSDEVEKVLASGTFMESSTLKRLFQVIISRIEASWAKGPSQQRKCTYLLSRLRNFDTKQFDILMNTWLRRFLQYRERPMIVHVLGPLISADCTNFRDVIKISEVVMEFFSRQSEPSDASRLSYETLSLLVGTSNEPEFMNLNDVYHLAIRRLHFQKDHPQEALSLIQQVVELGQPTFDAEGDSLALLCRSEEMRKFLCQTVLNDFDTVFQGLVLPLTKTLSSQIREQLINLIEPLLDPEERTKAQGLSLAYRVEHILSLANDLTLPFCQLELQMIFATEAGEWSIEENSSTECLGAFERAVDSAIAADNRSWTRIIPVLDVQIARHLCHRAERLLLQLVPSTKTEESMGSVAENDDLAKKLLFVIHATIYSIQGSQNPHIASQIVEKLNDIWQIASHGTRESRCNLINKWLPLILDFITLNNNMFDNSKSSFEVRSRMLLSLSALLLELQTWAQPLLVQRIFDVAILLVDDLPDEARLNCIRSLKDKTFNPNIEYIFGYSAPPSDWLQLSQNGKLIPYPLRRWEILSEPTPIVGDNDTSLSLTLFRARKI